MIIDYEINLHQYSLTNFVMKLSTKWIKKKKSLFVSGYIITNMQCFL